MNQVLFYFPLFWSSFLQSSFPQKLVIGHYIALGFGKINLALLLPKVHSGA
jgi:hypothetical protein